MNISCFVFKSFKKNDDTYTLVLQASGNYFFTSIDKFTIDHKRQLLLRNGREPPLPTDPSEIFKNLRFEYISRLGKVKTIPIDSPIILKEKGVLGNWFDCDIQCPKKLLKRPLQISFESKLDLDIQANVAQRF